MMAHAQMQPFTSSAFQFYKLSWFCKSVYAHMHVSSFLPVPEMQLPCRGNKTFFLKHQCKAGYKENNNMPLCIFSALVGTQQLFSIHPTELHVLLI